jgi:hypothetical protein
VYQTWQTATVTNCTFHDNDAGLVGSGASLRVQGGDLLVQNTILWGSTTDQISANIGNVTLEYCDVFGGASGVGVFDSDPLFVAPLTGDLQLSALSPCIDAADGDLAPAVDLIGNPRVDIATVTNGGVGTPDYVDIGAYEYQP